MISRLGWLLPLTLILTAGCTDGTHAVGQEGRIEYGMSARYDVPERDLRKARIVAGHEQRIGLELTDRGRRDISTPTRLQHRISPSLHTRIATETSGDGAWVAVTVQDAGAYTLESLLDGEVMDAIDLRFERPAAFEVVVKARAPWGEHFSDVAPAATLRLEQGSQITLQPIPVDASRRRLVGDLRARVDIEPDWAVTPGQGVLAVDEWGVWAVSPELDFYLIEPGPLSFTFRDTVNGAGTAQAFEVTPVER